MTIFKEYEGVKRVEKIYCETARQLESKYKWTKQLNTKVTKNEKAFGYVDLDLDHFKVFF